MKVCDMDCFNCKFPDCIKEDVYPERERFCNRSEESKQKIREYQREYKKKKYDEARAKGLCGVCKKMPATHGVRCYECYLKQKKYDKKKNTGTRQMRHDLGLCYFCGAPPKEGFRVCEKHYSIYHKAGVNVAFHPNTQKARKEYKKWIWCHNVGGKKKSGK